MKIEHLEERVADYRQSIDTVVKKKNQWEAHTRALIKEVLQRVVDRYDIGWTVQELSWMNSNEAVNIIFEEVPPTLSEQTGQCPTYRFINGSALVFTPSYSGDIYIFISLPVVEGVDYADNLIDLEYYTPDQLTEKLIVEKVDRFLKEVIAWEVPTKDRQRLGFLTADAPKS